MRIIDQGTIVASRPKTDAASACFPHIAVLPSGRWLAGFRLAPAKNSRTSDVFVAHSDDQGKTWSPPRRVAPPLAFEGVPGHWRAAALTPLGGDRVLCTLAWEACLDPLQPMFNESTEGLVDMKLFVCQSRDGGMTFQTGGDHLRLVHCGPYRNVPTPITGPTLRLPDGRWVAQFEVNKHYDDTTPWQHASAVVLSADEGRTWGPVGIAHTDPARRVYCWDQRPAVIPDGSILDLFWTFDREAAVYRNIHAALSRDGGRTWGQVYDTGVPGQPAPAVGLSGGRIAMVYVDRTADPCIKARLSRDGGVTFPADTEIMVYQRPLRTQTWQKGTMQDAWAEMSQYSLGLPATAALPGDQFLVALYSGNAPDYTDVLWVRVQA